MQERGTVPPLSRPAAAARPAGNRRRRLAVTAGVAAAVVAADQVTKTLAVEHLHAPVHLLGPLGLSLGYNSGAAFSLFTGHSAALVVVDVALVVVLVVLAWWARSAWVALSLGLILGGALSNLADRALRPHHGGVVDFITLTHWPTFNLADACIDVGVVLFALTQLWRPRPAADDGAPA